MSRLDQTDIDNALFFPAVEHQCWELLVEYASKYRHAETDDELILLYLELGREERSLARIAADVTQWYQFDFFEQLRVSVTALQRTIESALTSINYD
jgi:hypothetical protein